MELLISIVVFLLIAGLKASKTTNEELTRRNRVNETNPWGTTGAGQPHRTQQNANWQQVAKENIEKARQRAMQAVEEKVSEIQTSAPKNVWTQETVQKEENDTARQQIHASRVEARTTTILDRAKANADEDKVDVTLHTMEAEHNHSERVAPAEHHHPEDVIPESMLGNIEDLMIKGYDGNLCFERDFVGEAMDMISRFTVPSGVPDFSDDEEGKIA